MRKKILTLVLAFAIMMTFMPSMAFAGDATPITSVNISMTTPNEGTVSLNVGDDCTFSSSTVLTFWNLEDIPLYKYYYDFAAAGFKWQNCDSPLEIVEGQPDLTNAAYLTFNIEVKGNEAFEIKDEAELSFTVDSVEYPIGLTDIQNGVLSFNGTVQLKKKPVDTLTISYPSILDKEFAAKCNAGEYDGNIEMTTSYSFYKEKDSAVPKFVVEVDKDGKTVWLDEEGYEIKAEDAPKNLADFDHVMAISTITALGDIEFTESTKVNVTNLDKEIQSYYNVQPSATNVCGHKIAPNESDQSVLKSFYYVDIDQITPEKKDTKSIIESAMIIAAITATVAVISNIVLAPAKHLGPYNNPFISGTTFNMFTRTTIFQRQLEQARIMLYQQIVQRLNFCMSQRA